MKSGQNYLIFWIHVNHFRIVSKKLNKLFSPSVPLDKLNPPVRLVSDISYDFILCQFISISINLSIMNENRFAVHNGILRSVYNIKGFQK